MSLTGAALNRTTVVLTSKKEEVTQVVLVKREAAIQPDKQNKRFGVCRSKAEGKEGAKGEEILRRAQSAAQDKNYG